MENEKKNFIIISVIAFVILLVLASKEPNSSIETSKSTPTEKVTVTPAKKVVPKPTQAIKTKINISPYNACKYFSQSMPTQGYKNYQFSISDWGDYGTYACNSDYKKLAGYTNNIAYYVYGDSDAVNAVSLTLNIHEYGYEAIALQELIKDSNVLVSKVIGKKLPSTIKDSILFKTAGEWQLSGYKIKLIQEEFTQGDGGVMLVFLIEV